MSRDNSTLSSTSCQHNNWPPFNPLVVPTSPVYIHVLCWVTQWCLTLCDPIDCSLRGSSLHGDSPSKNTGVGCQTLLQGIFKPRDQTQVSRNAGGFFIIWAYVYGSYIQAHIYIYIYTYIGFPGGASGKESACQCKRHRFNPWVGKILWRRKCQSIPVFLPGKLHGQGSLEVYSP